MKGHRVLLVSSACGVLSRMCVLVKGRVVVVVGCVLCIDLLLVVLCHILWRGMC